LGTFRRNHGKFKEMLGPGVRSILFIAALIIGQEVYPVTDNPYETQNEIINSRNGAGDSICQDVYIQTFNGCPMDAMACKELAKNAQLDCIRNSSEIENVNDGLGGLESLGGGSMQEFESEARRCMGKDSDARTCCGDPSQCGIDGTFNFSLAGMSGSCEQLKNSAQSAYNSNVKAGSICSERAGICSTSCEDTMKKWNPKFQNCATDPSCDPVMMAKYFNDMRAAVSRCKEDYPKAESQMIAQADENRKNVKASKACQQASTINPQKEETADKGKDPQTDGKAEPASKPSDQTTADNSDSSKEKKDEQQQQGGGLGDAMQGLMNQQQQKDEAKTASTQDTCSLYPNSPGCGGTADNFNDPSKVESTKGDAASLSDFNTGSIDGLPQQPQFGNYEAKGAQGRAIPNGGGGFTGGGGGGSGFGDEGQANGGDGSRTNTDILNGMRGGGGASGSNNVDPSAISGGGGFSGYGNSSGFRNRFKGLDLKQYLPGGKKDPSRKIASVKNPTGHADIAPVGESMFKIISTRMSLMCKMKRLIGCD